MGVLASGHHRTLSERVHTVIGLAKSHVVLIVAVIAAAVTCVFVPPDAGYADYFDLDTLSCLFCTLAVVSALKERRFFEWMAGKIVTAFGNMRRVAFALVFVTYFGSMIMANDMALVTFLPLGYYALSSCGRREHTAFVFVMQNVAANLGGMLTPFGNPQNLYLYSYYAIPAGEFFAFFGERDHYRRSGIVSIRTWRKYFGEGTWATYPGTHFMEEEYVLSMLIPKIVSVLVLMQDGSPVHP